MSPYKANSKRINICPHASEGCAASCLVNSGNGGRFSMVMQGRINKTEYFLSDRMGFLSKLKIEIEKAIKKHEGKEVVTFRLNGTSDISYEKFKVFDGKNIFELFENVEFYDYTKNWTRFTDKLPKNYHLTFSRSETNETKAFELLAKGYNVSIVFDKLPSEYKGYKVINGDEHDLRLIDPRGVIVGLKYKNNTGAGAKDKNIEAFRSGFAIRLNELKESEYKLYEKLTKKSLVISE